MVMETIIIASSGDPDSSALSRDDLARSVRSKNRTKDIESSGITPILSDFDAGRHLPNAPGVPLDRRSRSFGQSSKRIYLARGMAGSLACPFRTSPPEVLITWSKNGSPLFANQNGDYGDTDDFDDSDDSDDSDGEPLVAATDATTDTTSSSSSSPSSSSLGGLVVYQVPQSIKLEPIRKQRLARDPGDFRQDVDRPQRPSRKRPRADADFPYNRVKVTKEGRLRFKVVLEEDEGTYACHRYSPFTVASRNSTYFKVLVREVPRFSRRPSDFYQSRQGHTVTLVCVAVGDPKPMLIWRKLDGPFPPINRTLQEEGNLTLARVTPADGGRYECMTFNLLGMTHAGTTLIVEDGTAHGPTHLEVSCSSNCMTVSWYPAYHPDSQDPSFFHYLIWYREADNSNNNNSGSSSGASNWTTVSPPPNSSTVALQTRGGLLVVSTATTGATTFCDLRPSTGYEVLVMSRDAEGESTFSELAAGKTEGPREKIAKHRTKTKDNGSPALEEKQTTKESTSSTNPSLWRRPMSPKNLTAILKNGGLLLSWQSPPPLYFRRRRRPEVRREEGARDRALDHAALTNATDSSLTTGPDEPHATGDVTNDRNRHQHHQNRHHHHHHRHQQHQTPRMRPRPGSDANATGKVELSKVSGYGRIQANHCVIEFKTLGRWVPLSGRLNSSLTNFLWSTVSMGTVYHFRVVCYYALAVAGPRKAKAPKMVRGRYSEVVQFSTEVPSPQPAVRMSNAKVGGVIFVVMVTLFVLSSSPFLFKFLREARKRSARGQQYVCAKHGGSTAGTNHLSNSTNALKSKPKVQDIGASSSAEVRNSMASSSSNHISMTRTPVSLHSCPSEFVEVEATV